MNPELRFKKQDGKDFPDWETKKIKEIGKVAMCRRIFKDQTLDFGEIPFFKIGTFGDVADAFITRELFEEFKKKYPYPEKGNILISASGSIGKLVEYDGSESYFQDSNIVWLDHKKDVSDEYLKQIYSTLDWEEGLEGSTIKRLYNKVFLNKVIFVPQTKEQEKVAKLLGDVDKKIETQAILIEKLKNTKEAMLVKMFPQGDSKVPEIRFDGFSGDWEEKKLEAITQFIKDGTHNSFKDSKFGYPLLSAKDIYDNKIHIPMDSRIISKEDYDSIYKTYQLQENDVFLTIVGTIGRTAIYEKDTPEIALQRSVAIIRLKKEYNHMFISQLMGRYYFQNELLKRQNKGAQGGIYLGSLGKIEIVVPKYDEQEKIGQFLANLDKEIEINQKKYEKLCDVKKALLHKMFPTKGDE